jgi:hypothetical protein
LLQLVKFTSPAVAPATCSSSNANGFGWRQGATIVIGDDEGPVTGPTALKVTQNSENIGFGFWHDLIDADRHVHGFQSYTFGPGQFDVILSIKGHHMRRMDLHAVIDVVDAPTQTP